MDVPPHPPNPDYGHAVYRRAIRLINRPGETIGELEDSEHALRMRLVHGDGRVIRITADFSRHPMTTCPAAGSLLAEFEGLPLDTPLSWFYGEGRPRRHCTHMHDLAWWLLSHARRDEKERIYEIEVPDHPAGREIVARLSLNGEQRLALTIRDDIVQAPETYVGQNMFKRFVSWALATLTGEELEAALMLQKGYFVSLMHAIRPVPGPLASIEEAFVGACWSFNRPQFDKAERIDSHREFDAAEELLGFRG